MRRTTVAWSFLSVSALAGPALAQTGGLTARNSPLQVVEPDANERELRMTPVVRAVQKAADSVVSIYLQHQLTRGAVTEGQGSGVILDENGLVITNWHVIASVVLGAERGDQLDVQVKLRDGRARAARVMSSSSKRDLALLQLKVQGDEKFKPIEIGRSGDLMIGETVIAIGNPQGHANSVTSGVLSAIDRKITVRTPDGATHEYGGLLQTDAAINAGNSGGALLDITGRLIGINNAMAVGAENIGFAIPMDTVREEFERELLQSGSFAAAADAAWLGLEVADHDGAVVVDRVVPGGPAHAAGVRAGDVLTAIGTHQVKTTIDYLRQLLDARPRREIPLQLRRGSQDVKAAPLPLSRDEGVLLSAFGATAVEIDAQADAALVRKATTEFYRGTNLRRVQLLPAVLRVQNVQEDGPASATGLKAGDVLLSVLVPQDFGGEREFPLTSLHDLASWLDRNRGQTVRLGILRGDEGLLATVEVRRAH